MMVIYLKNLMAFIFVFGMLLGCGSAEKPMQNNTYFAWSAFLKHQMNGYAKSNQRVHKTVVLDGKKEVKIVSNLDWEKEFALYLEADLNKLAYEKSYDNLSEPGFYWYSLKKDENLPVKKMIIHLDAEERPTKVEIEMAQKNFLFETRKKLFMSFSDGKIQTYYIEGMQQFFLAQPTNYKILGVLIAK
jgi:hypothetical protein